MDKVLEEETTQKTPADVEKLVMQHAQAPQEQADESQEEEESKAVDTDEKTTNKVEDECEEVVEEGNKKDD